MDRIFNLIKLKGLPAKTQDATRKLVKLKLTHVNDIDDILNLLYKEGWVDYARDDLEFLFDYSPRGCFKFVVDKKIIGVVFATLTENDICYPNNLLIAKEYRGKVKSFSEMQKYDNYLKSISQVQLIYSIERKIDIYSGIWGYKSLDWYQRFNLLPRMSEAKSNHVIVTSPDDYQLKYVFVFLAETYHHDRQRIICFFLERKLAKGIIVYDAKGRVIGWAMARKRPKGVVLGPIVAISDRAALELIQAALDLYPGQSLQLDGPLQKLKTLLDSHNIGYTEDGSKMMKMFEGNPDLRENPDRLYAIFSHYID